MGHSVKNLTVVIATVALLASSLACGQSDNQAAAAGSFEQVVPRLPTGLSVEEVEARLGEPRDKFEAEDSEIVLAYGLWQVVFHPSLYKRTRIYPAHHWPANRPVGPLDRKIRALKLGLFRRTVELKIGKTETWQVLDLGTNERLWYGNGRWKLHLVDGRLAGKVLYD
jgi:hypothetical protein